MRRVTSLRVRPEVRNTVAYLFLIGIVGYVCVLITGRVNLETREMLIHYWVLSASGILAILPPHVLLPDPHLQLLQVANRDRRQLLIHQLKRWSPTLFGLAIPGFVLAFHDPGSYLGDFTAKSLMLFENLIVILGVGLYSLAHYVGIGPLSQAWQEKTRGQFYRVLKEHSSTPLHMPEGLVPSFLATGRVFIIGVLFTVATILAKDLGFPMSSILPGLGLLLWAGFKVARLLRSYDRYFYQTNAFFGEVLGTGGNMAAEGQQPIAYDAIYWVPQKWRPQAWISVIQLDRRLPLGRFILLGHLLLWILFFKSAAADTITAYLLLFLLAKNSSVYLLTTRQLAPQAPHVAWQSPGNWALIRAFVNLRWTLSLVLSAMVVAAFSTRFSGTDVLFWIAVDLVFAFCTAFIVTYVTEFQYRKQFR